MKIATALQMREADRKTIEDVGIPGTVLMENAGRETVSVIERSFDSLRYQNIVVICGKGNNGGDGFVISRHLWNHGYSVRIILLTQRQSLSGDARINAEVAFKLGISITEIETIEQLRDNCSIIKNADVIIDAILGTGLKSEVRGLFAEVIKNINSSDSSVVSVDIPSGLVADCPDIPPVSVNSDLTITYGLPKLSLILQPAAETAGQVFVADISIPKLVVDSMAINTEILNPGHFPTFFLPRSTSSHKGSYGHLLTIAGSPGKTGAAILACSAAIRAGAGLVSAAVPEAINSSLESNLIEVMTIPLAGKHKYFHLDHLDLIREEMVGKSALLIGPGIGTSEGTSKLLKQIIYELDSPVVLDADALNIISRSNGPWFRQGIPTIITPHPGEMSRLTGYSVKDLLSHQIEIVPEFAKVNDCIVVFKTSRTMIAYPDGTVLINIVGNPGMASGGTGDVLAGIIAGLITRGIMVEQAVAAGVFWHGLSGELAAKKAGEEEMLASDLLHSMAEARSTIQEFSDFFTGTAIPHLDFADIESSY